MCVNVESKWFKKVETVFKLDFPVFFFYSNEVIIENIYYRWSTESKTILLANGMCACDRYFKNYSIAYHSIAHRMHECCMKLSFKLNFDTKQNNIKNKQKPETRNANGDKTYNGTYIIIPIRIQFTRGLVHIRIKVSMLWPIYFDFSTLVLVPFGPLLLSSLSLSFCLLLLLK